MPKKKSPVNGQPVPDGTPFRTSDERARLAEFTRMKAVLISE